MDRTLFVRILVPGSFQLSCAYSLFLNVFERSPLSTFHVEIIHISSERQLKSIQLRLLFESVYNSKHNKTV
jgi:hypothetical protein